MERFRCTNPECMRPILFEGDFIGTIQKICPKCKKMNVYIKKSNNIYEKYCIT